MQLYVRRLGKKPTQKPKKGEKQDHTRTGGDNYRDTKTTI